MPSAELERLELVAQIDALAAALRQWSEHAPHWPPGAHCRRLVAHLSQQTDALLVRVDAPLVVGLLGGTGTGKSALVNALCGAEVTPSGKERPTTRWPTLVCRPDLKPEMLGIDPESVRVVHAGLPALGDLVLLDCPDPDTTEDPDAPATNLARLRDLLPHCDVLLVTTTQQKYRSARVSDELAAAAAGARLVLVQTHADVDDDIRDDWRRMLAADYECGEMFFIDSPAALRQQQSGMRPRGEFGRLVDLLSGELAGAARHRIRQANYLDLVEETLGEARRQLDEALAPVGRLEAAIAQQRAALAARLAADMRRQLLDSRRSWENRLLAEVTARWGFSPFAALLRAWQALGTLVSGAWLLRARSPAQLALWGAYEGGRRLRRHQQEKRSSRLTARAAGGGWQPDELLTAALLIEGYAIEAGLPRDETRTEHLAGQAARASEDFVAMAAGQVQPLVARLAARHSGWLTRWRYELLLGAMLAALGYRFGRNFFYDSWLAVELGLAGQPQPLLGLDFFLAAAIVTSAWCGLLLWAFTARLRRGLRGAIEEVARSWTSPELVAGLLGGLAQQCRAIRDWRQQLDGIANRAADLQARLRQPDARLGHRHTEHPIGAGRTR